MQIKTEMRDAGQVTEFFDVVGNINAQGVSWGAVLAGAAAAAALAFILLILGLGLGLSTVSPWSYNQVAIGTSTIVWLALTQILASGLGGYLSGRLRVKWVAVHTDEVYFRDTAHGLLAWAVATLVTAAFLAGAVKTVLSDATDATVQRMHSDRPHISNMTDANGRRTDYFVNMLLRNTHPLPEATNDTVVRNEISNAANNDVKNEAKNEIKNIFANNLRGGALNNDDKQYLGEIVSKHTGLNQVEADKRVDAIYARFIQANADDKIALDAARKIAAHTALWMFVALLCGAFFACLCATFGGRRRDAIFD